MKNYTVSKDSKSGMWYAHHKKFPYIPVSGSFQKKKSDAMEYAKMYNLQSNKVEEIEQRRKEKFQKEMELTEAENMLCEQMEKLDSVMDNMTLSTRQQLT